MGCSAVRWRRTLQARSVATVCNEGRKDMGVLTQDMRNILASAMLTFVATVRRDGSPSLSPKASTIPFDDDHLIFMPDVHIYVRSKLPWVALPEGVPSFDAYYDARKLWPPASLERRHAQHRLHMTDICDRANHVDD